MARLSKNRFFLEWLKVLTGTGKESISYVAPLDVVIKNIELRINQTNPGSALEPAILIVDLKTGSQAEDIGTTFEPTGLAMANRLVSEVNFITSYITSDVFFMLPLIYGSVDQHFLLARNEYIRLDQGDKFSIDHQIVKTTGTALDINVMGSMEVEAISYA